MNAIVIFVGTICVICPDWSHIGQLILRKENWTILLKRNNVFTLFDLDVAILELSQLNQPFVEIAVLHCFIKWLVKLR